MEGTEWIRAILFRCFDFESNITSYHRSFFALLNLSAGCPMSEFPSIRAVLPDGKTKSKVFEALGILYVRRPSLSVSIP